MVFFWGADEGEEGLVGRRRLLGLGLGLGLRVGGRAWVEVVRMVVRRRVMMDDVGYISNTLWYFRLLMTKKQRFCVSSEVLSTGFLAAAGYFFLSVDASVDYAQDAPQEPQGLWGFPGPARTTFP